MQNNYYEIKYLNWIVSLIDGDISVENFTCMLFFLFNKDFTYTVLLDENRYDDGINLRYLYDCNHDEEVSMQDELSNKKCSVLEMMVALAMKCENQIMDDPDIGNRTWFWFWKMIENLDIMVPNEHFESYRQDIENKIDIFLNRGYDFNGKGGLFIVNNPKYDMKEVEIWYQMCWYLDEILY